MICSYNPRMIDAHIHVAPPNLPGVGSLAGTLRMRPEAVAAALTQEMKSAGVKHVFAMGEWNVGDDDPLGIRRTLAIAEHAPGLKPIGICCPKRGDQPDHLKRVEEELARGRVVALKCYLGYLHFEPAHPNYRRYYELAAHFKIPVVFHTGDTYSPEAKLKYAHPLGVDEVAVDHPKTKFVMAHLGNPWTVDAAEVIYKNLNVWADLSGLVVGDGLEPTEGEHFDALNDIANRVRAAFRYAERPNRFLFGTDWPLIPIAPYAEFVRQVIPQVHHAQVFDENARVVFKVG
jgi:predicted TIM-barrel fold metal-dependent hydrolase